MHTFGVFRHKKLTNLASLSCVDFGIVGPFIFLWTFGSKAELPQVGIFFTFNFLPWEFLLTKKLEIDKNKTIYYTTFKTDIIEVVLVFSISNFFINKNSQGRKLSVV